VEVERLPGSQARRHLLTEASSVGEARRAAMLLALEAGLDETATGRVGIVVTELGNNLVRHAGGGELLLQLVQSTHGAAQLEVVSMDTGPGMADVSRCLEDGYSTGGTPGNGLGAVRRLSSLFDVYSVPGRGTIIVSRIGPGKAGEFGGISTAVSGETRCGDCWRVAQELACTAAIVLDGLGHGDSAAAAADAGAAAFAGSPFDPPQLLIERVHQRLQGTRGAAAACVQRTGEGRLLFAGIGNISARAIGRGHAQGLTSHNGILGVQARRVQQFDYDGTQLPLLVMHSDGVSARWDLDQYEGLRTHHAAVIAAVLYRDHRRARDDATILVIGHG
jgi:anti-sigma regulatory factor (Ser/Thr protein kinase)